MWAVRAVGGGGGESGEGAGGRGHALAAFKYSYLHNASNWQGEGPASNRRVVWAVIGRQCGR